MKNQPTAEDFLLDTLMDENMYWAIARKISQEQTV